MTPEEFTQQGQSLTTEKRPWSDLEKLCIMADVSRDGYKANYGLVCFVCKQPWLQYEYTYRPFEGHAYCHNCKDGYQQGKK